jgi:hypothetical protein
VDKFAKNFFASISVHRKDRGPVQEVGRRDRPVWARHPRCADSGQYPGRACPNPLPKFFLATFAGAYVWCTLLIGAGYLLGHEWQLISEYIKTHLPLVFIFGFLFIAAYLVYHYRASLPVLGLMRQNNKELDP